MQKVGKGSSLQCALGALAQAGIEQGLPGGARAVICAANLIPLRKKDNSVRPIAVGETLRRMIGTWPLPPEVVLLGSWETSPGIIFGQTKFDWRNFALGG